MSRDFSRALGTTNDSTRGIPQVDISAAGNSSQLTTYQINNLCPLYYQELTTQSQEWSEHGRVQAMSDCEKSPQVSQDGVGSCDVAWLYRNLGQASVRPRSIS